MATVSPSERSRASSGTSMEGLSVDVMVKILEFSVIPERLNLAMTSKSLLTLITKECSLLWVHMDFHPFQYSPESLKNKNEKLSDDMLAALLTRVNARDITKSLCLKGCVKFVGNGLEPLRGSRVLECVNLRVGWNKNMKLMEERIIMDIIRTMVRYKLFQVRFQDWRYNFDKETWKMLIERRGSFYRDMQAAKSQQAREEGIVCSRCCAPVCDNARQVVPNFHGTPPTCCGICCKQYCRTGACSATVRDCAFCQLTSCDSCDKVQQCDDCQDSYCGDCAYVSAVPCLVCKGKYCNFCVDTIYCSDPNCGNHLCGYCDGSADIFARIQFCNQCEAAFCSDCCSFSSCTECGLDFCAQCHENRCCIRCNQVSSTCFDCDGIEMCNHCGKTKCAACTDESGGLKVEYCEICDRCFCSQCGRVEVCFQCSKHGLICGECCRSCDECGKSQCDDCKETRGPGILTCERCHESPMCDFCRPNKKRHGCSRQEPAAKKQKVTDTLGAERR